MCRSVLVMMIQYKGIVRNNNYWNKKTGAI